MTNIVYSAHAYRTAQAAAIKRSNTISVDENFENQSPDEENHGAVREGLELGDPSCLSGIFDDAQNGKNQKTEKMKNKKQQVKSLESADDTSSSRQRHRRLPSWFSSVTTTIAMKDWSLYSYSSKKFDKSGGTPVTTTSTGGHSSRTVVGRHGGRHIQEFSLTELALATDQFSLENRVGKGSFGSIYKGKLQDRAQDVVAIRMVRVNQENTSAFESELALLSRLHHKHITGIVGFCEEREERLMVYEYMENGSLYEHLHPPENAGSSSSSSNSSPLNSWKMRIRILSEAARGIEYLHNYAVPPVIHRAIKPSNILLDSMWTAKVSDFGYSVIISEQVENAMSVAGTLGYIDPTYYESKILTTRSDIYSFGIVILEVLTGKTAIFEDDEGSLNSIVHYAGTNIKNTELFRILDATVGELTVNEAEAVELVARTGMAAIQLEGKDRPTIKQVLANLERALALIEEDNDQNK